MCVGGQISSEKREVLRSFLTLVNGELLKRQRPNSAFNFHGGKAPLSYLVVYEMMATYTHNVARQTAQYTATTGVWLT